MHSMSAAIRLLTTNRIRINALAQVQVYRRCMGSGVHAGGWVDVVRTKLPVPIPTRR